MRSDWRRSVHAVTILVIAVTASSCLPSPSTVDVDRVDVQVHALLRAGSDSAAVFVGQASVESPWLVPLSGLEVHLRRGDTVFTLSERLGEESPCIITGGPPEDSTAAGCYSAAIPGGIQAGESFELRIMGTDAIDVRGSAVIPPPPRLLSPAADTVVALGCASATGKCEPGRRQPRQVGQVTIEWQAEPTLGWIEVGTVMDSAYAGGAAITAACFAWLVEFNAVAEADDERLTLGIESLYCAEQQVVHWDTVYATLWVAGFDTAYARYRRAYLNHEQGISETDAAAGLEGAFGYFAGVGVTASPIRFARAGPE